MTRTADPLALPFFVEALTDEIEQRARAVMAQIEDAGGAVRALATISAKAIGLISRTTTGFALTRGLPNVQVIAALTAKNTLTMRPKPMWKP